MPLEEVKNSTTRVIGSKQVKKALAKGGVKKVYIAADAEHHIVEPLKKLCQQQQVEFIMAESMVELGRACGIDVGSATVALL
ncbi:MAG: ribosomal L7Ae/L30e/S12e/Gadd45 family protein [Syntrophomonadaceae bacterium]|nr:ribosomal L7Ae/L30e/S12e/Gadd45 family protein [Syntrophomonadaceae bacterium]